MKKIIFLILSFLFIFVLAGCSLPGQKPKYAGLNISSNPRSTVFFDDKHIGQTPYYDEKLKPQEYVIKLMPDMEATAASPWQTKIKLNPETLTVIKREFDKNTGESSGEILSLTYLGKNKQPELNILVNPDGAGIKVDGSFKGTAPLIISDLKQGDHEIEISMVDYISRPIKVKLEPGYRLTINVDLAKSDASFGEIKPTIKLSPVPTTAKTGSEPTGTPSKEPTGSGTKTLEIGSKIIITETETGWLNVREQPSGSISAQVNPGQKFSVLDLKTGWVKIEYETGKEGWVSDSYVKVE